MATVNLTRDKDYYKQRTAKYACAVIDYDQIAGTDDYELFVLPKNALIVDAYLDVLTAAQASTTFDLGFAGGSELLSAAAASSVAIVAGTVNADTGTGKTVTLTPNQAPTAGKFVVCIEFVEYTKGDGDLMDLSTN